VWPAPARPGRRAIESSRGGMSRRPTAAAVRAADHLVAGQQIQRVTVESTSDTGGIWYYCWKRRDVGAVRQCPATSRKRDRQTEKKAKAWNRLVGQNHREGAARPRSFLHWAIRQCATTPGCGSRLDPGTVPALQRLEERNPRRCDVITVSAVASTLNPVGADMLEALIPVNATRDGWPRWPRHG